MRVVINREKCVGAGQCVLSAPKVFSQCKEDGIVVLLVPNPPMEDHENVREAADLCPAQAITMEEDCAGSQRTA